MKQILEFNPTDPSFTNFSIRNSVWAAKFPLSVAAGSRFRCRIYNVSPIQLTVRFGDVGGSNDVLPAFTSKFYDLNISQPILAFGLPGTVKQGSNSQQGTIYLSGFTSLLYTVQVIQYDESEIVYDTIEHSVNEPSPFYSDSDSWNIAQSTTVEFLIPQNTPITSFENNGLLQYIFIPTGIDVTCRAVTTAQKLVVHVNNVTTGVTVLDFEWQQLTTDNLREYIRFPKDSFLSQGTNPLPVPLTSAQYSVKVFALAFGAQQIDLNVYWSAYMYTSYALAPLA